MTTFVWLLVFLINVDNAGRTVGPFESRAACEHAMKQVQDEWRTSRLVCVRVLNK